MAIINKKAETLAAPAPEQAAVKTTPEKKAPAARKPAAPKAVKAPKEPKAVKAPKAPRAAKSAKVQVFVEYQGRQVEQEALLAAVKADWTGEAIKTLELYVKPEDGAVYYVVNGEGTGKVEF